MTYVLLAIIGVLAWSILAGFIYKACIHLGIYGHYDWSNKPDYSGPSLLAIFMPIGLVVVSVVACVRLGMDLFGDVSDEKES